MKRVVVVYGGWSNERAISLVSGQTMTKAAKTAGYDVVGIDAGRDLASQINTARPDVILNGLHGPWGEDGCVQGLFEVLGIPYSHSGVLASSLAMDKIRSRIVFADAGLKIAEGYTVSREDLMREHPMAPPYVIKPVREGSSFGVVLVKEGDRMPPRAIMDPDWCHGSNLMVEAYIPGQELTVTVMDERALAVTEVKTARTFYDFDAKYTAGQSNHVVPANLPAKTGQVVLDAALKAHRALGCRGVSRSDFRFDEAGEGLVILETNTQPGMTPTSLVPEQAACCGMSLEQLVTWMIEDASCQR